MKKLMLIGVVLLLTGGAYAQILTPVKWSYAAKKTGPNEATLYIRATIDAGWHIYSQKTSDGPVATTFTFSPSKQYTLTGKTVEPMPVTKFEKAFNANVSYFENTVMFTQKVKLNAAVTTVKGKLEYMTCNDQKCLPPEDLDFTIAVK